MNYKDEDFNNYIFVDETSVIVFDKPLYHLRLRSSTPISVPCSSKHKSKVNVWGGISFKGPTLFAVFFSFSL